MPESIEGWKRGSGAGLFTITIQLEAPMQTPEKRWQLLLVADDGRIVPFKRFRGLAIALIVLLVLMILLCAGLGWQWAAERSSHARTREQLAKLRQTADQLKNSHKRLIAALATAQTRPEPVTTAVPPDRKETPTPLPLTGRPSATQPMRR